MEKSYPNTLIPRYPGAREYPYCPFQSIRQLPFVTRRPRLNAKYWKSNCKFQKCFANKIHIFYFLLSISELMAVALCYLATQVKWLNTQNRTVNSKNAMPTKFIFSTFQFIFLSFKTLLFVSIKQTLPCNLASKFTAFFLKWTVVV